MDLNKSSSEDSTDEEQVIRDFEKEAQLVIEAESLPKKSVDRYYLVYKTFLKWKDENKANSFEESVLICYFSDLQKKVCPSTAWSVWSILKKMLNTKHNVDISKFYKLKGILQLNSKNYKPKKSLVLSWDHIMNFLKKASDHTYLGAKVLINIIIFYFLCSSSSYNPNSHQFFRPSLFLAFAVL